VDGGILKEGGGARESSERERIVRRAALELQNGDYVNLGEP
jgi:acyl CoA:acetate/3-ketoacid CoA transferase beta subunit